MIEKKDLSHNNSQIYTTEQNFPLSSIVVGIPAFNEAKNIRDVIKKAKLHCDKVIVCDDGSVDDTEKVARSEGALVIKHPKNKGYGSAIKTLFDYAKNEKYAVLVTLDSDGQHDAGDIPKIVEPILRGQVDIVIGSRFLNDSTKNNIPRYRKIGIRTITKIIKATSYEKISDSQSGFRAYSKNVISKIAIHEDGMSVSTEILFNAKEQNLSVLEVPIKIRYDVDNASTHNPLTHGLSVLASVFRYASVKHPLSFYCLPGFGLLLVSIFFLGWALELFSGSSFVSTNMILLSMGFGVIGIVMIATGVILYTMTILIRGKFDNS